MYPASEHPLQISFPAQDGYVLKGTCWRHLKHDPRRPVVLINAATSVRCRYYARFAAFLHTHGFDVVTYDYRGIGESRPASIKGFEAGWIDWGRLDFEAALQYAIAEFPDQPIHVVAHSVGGFLIGLAASSHRIARVFTVGAQHAYWRDYAGSKRAVMVLKWHVVMPVLTAIFGYFPGRLLGWLEDTPRGVVRDWTDRHPHFVDAWRRGKLVLPEAECRELVERFAGMRAEILALGLSDDEFGTIEAIQRLLRYFSNSRRMHVYLTPEAIGESNVGHFAFFHSRFEDSLWKIPLEWLQHERLPSQPQGKLFVFPAQNQIGPSIVSPAIEPRPVADYLHAAKASAFSSIHRITSALFE
jgi:predicted alpha/beta hydrolase